MSKEIKYAGKYLTITEEKIDHVTYERVDLRSGVRVFPIQDKKLLFIKEFRTREGKARWKMVSGWIDKEGKTPLEIAQEEFAEEAGMRAQKWEEFYVYDTLGATIGNKVHCFIAQEVSSLDVKVENPDHDEILDVAWVTLEELYDLINHHEMFWNDETVACIQALRLYGK